MKRASWINLILGIWLIISPFVFGSMGLRVTVGNNIVLGIVLIASSWWILATVTRAVGVSWFQMLCGIWLVVAPFILHYRAVTHALANDVVVGIIVFVVGLIESQVFEHRPVKTA
jgi:thiol:disulfide interchange protein